MFCQKNNYVKKMYEFLAGGKFWQKASYTIEAAFVVPILLGIAFVILYVLFLFRDTAVLQGNLSRGIYLAAEGQITCERKEYRPILEESLWLVKIKEISFVEKQGEIHGKVTAEADIKIPVVNIFLQSRQEVTLQENASKVHPETIKRYGTKKDNRGG